ncbi:MAG: squalene/phytoene synthase family protein [Anaerolineae bacterium]|nr:squalene/phytoene synthase family protein [Gemmatimonadaceae bacterium]
MQRHGAHVTRQYESPSIQRRARIPSSSATVLTSSSTGVLPAQSRRSDRRLTPFWIRRPFLVLGDALVDRERPDLAALARIDDPERFVWAILPHAARTFSACIALLPSRAALPAAVAYLYCRMLDTYEDLVADRKEREASLLAFAGRLDHIAMGKDLPPAPTIAEASDRDERDRAHLLLVQRSALVDRVFASFDDSTRSVVGELVRDMAEGMRWSSETFASQGGVLDGEEQLAKYCRHVLGNPVIFTVRLLRLGRGLDTSLAPDENARAMQVGEMGQLANVTRDLEKDLRRGIAYDASLRADLGRDVRGDADATERVRSVRERLLRMALVRAPSYGRMVDAMRLPRLSLARASAVVMFLFTERYFRSCARRVGLPQWRGPDSMAAIFVRGFVAAASRERAAREIARIEGAFLECAREG